MRAVSNLVFSLAFLAALGCSGNKKIPIKEATPEEIQQQKEAEDLARTEESEMRKRQPKEKTVQQSVDEQERARRR